MKPDIKFGDIVTFTDGWYDRSQNKKPDKPVLFVATGNIKEELKGEYLICVVRKNRAYSQIYHHSFLKKINLGLASP